MKTNRGLIYAETVTGGYIMAVSLPDGGVEYPQEGRVHKTKRSIYDDAELMYPSDSAWEYDCQNHTILLDAGLQ